VGRVAELGAVGEITRLKKYPTTAFASEVWRELDFIFWRERVPCLPAGFTPDGIEPVTIETAKRGIEISGTMSLLPSGSCELDLCLLRPSFSSVESVSVAKLRTSTIIDASLDGQRLMISVSAALDTNDEELLA
jgi:hypothetical protein